MSYLPYSRGERKRQDIFQITLQQYDEVLLLLYSCVLHRVGFQITLMRIYSYTLFQACVIFLILCNRKKMFCSVSIYLFFHTKKLNIFQNSFWVLHNKESNSCVDWVHCATIFCIFGWTMPIILPAMCTSMHSSRNPSRSRLETDTFDFHWWISSYLTFSNAFVT